MATSYSDGEFKKLGLDIAYKNKRSGWQRLKPKTQLENYTGTYGVCPQTSSKIWNGLRNLDDQEARLPEGTKPIHLLLVHRFLWKYEEEEELARKFGMCANTVRKWVRIVLPRIELLLAPRMGNIEDHDDGLIFMLSIDGTHCPIEEPRPFSTIWSSHKLGGKPGVNYEIALTINHPRLVSVVGPTPPGKLNDISVFRSQLKHVMKARIPGRKAIGDSGYSGEPDLISLKNDFDPKEISEFKNRVMARHETFNQRLKTYKVLSTPFRHHVENHGMAFRAVCVMVLFQMDHGHGLLFDPYP